MEGQYESFFGGMNKPEEEQQWLYGVKFWQ
jgi:hypothetical protein